MKPPSYFTSKLQNIFLHFSLAKWLALVLTTFLWLPAHQALAIDEVWVFQHLALERTRQREFFLSIHERAKDSDIPTLYQIQPRAAVAIGDWSWVGFNYSFFGIRKRDNAIADENLFTHQHRLEPELQIRVNVRDGTRYVGRNRFEYLMDSEFRNLNERFRHRSQFIFNTPFHEQILFLSQIELFYDFGVNRLNQTRTSPIGLRIIQGPWSFQAQPMIVHVATKDGDWNSNLVANFEVTYEF